MGFYELNWTDMIFLNVWKYLFKQKPSSKSSWTKFGRLTSKYRLIDTKEVIFGVKRQNLDVRGRQSDLAYGLLLPSPTLL